MPRTNNSLKNKKHGLIMADLSRTAKNIDIAINKNILISLSIAFIMLLTIIIILMKPQKIDSAKPKALVENQEIIIPAKEEIVKKEDLEIEKEINNNKQEIIWKDITVKPNQSLYTLFKNQNIPIKLMVELLKNKNELTQKLSSLQKNDKILFGFLNNEFVAIKMDVDLEKNVLAQKNTDDSFEFATTEYPVDIKTNYAQISINSSLFEDASRAGIDSNIVLDIADIFAWDIDFSQDLHPGDMIELLYKEKYVNGEKVSQGPILFIDINGKKRLTAMRFLNANGNYEYYDPDGNNLRKAFIRNPVKFTRISSYFSLQRDHPILHRIRAHHGVDYAAPLGTPIKATGDGKITFLGRKGGYGKAIVISHGNKYTSLYGHMNSYAKNLQTGSTVKQGQIIGYVGKTGLATGPHLHYEFKILGERQDPLKVQLPNAKPISHAKSTDFNMIMRNYLAQVNIHRSIAKA